MIYYDDADLQKLSESEIVASVELRVANSVNYTENIITYDNLLAIKKNILLNGKTQTYCNMYNNNPFDETKSFQYYLDPDIGQKNINCDNNRSDFNHLTVRKKDFGVKQYIHINFMNKKDIIISTSWPKIELKIKEITFLARKSIIEYLKTIVCK